MVGNDESFEAMIRAHDHMIARRGIDVWVGSEPTFTRRLSESPEWLTEALGGEKEQIALRMLNSLLERNPGAVILRTVGRQYAGEPCPRWSVGFYARRDGAAVWNGPPDPMLTKLAPDRERLASFQLALRDQFAALGWQAVSFHADDPLCFRLCFRIDGNRPFDDAEQIAAWSRSSIHRHKIPEHGITDELSEGGDYLVSIGHCCPDQASAYPCLELPGFKSVDDFENCLAAIANAANRTKLSALVLQGFPPPVDARVAWTTITPDPAVIEVNQAPYSSIGEFLTVSRELFNVAEQVGLSPYRLQYNGAVSDSGGGGQFTLGGPSPDSSPFFKHAQLLPRLVRYFNRHPSLSYLFAPDSIGSSSQSPRADEGVRDSFHELNLALEQLALRAEPDPEFIWRSLAPFLTDPSGNSHRSEINIEKLWNPYLPWRGCLGLVEFRAFRMWASAERAAAVAALLRAIVAMLVFEDRVPGLCDWGDELHDRFALPYYLRADLQQVLHELDASGFGLGAPLEFILLDDSSRKSWRAEFEGCVLEIEKAYEFWPLVGDVATQESGGSRLVDASTARLQLSLRSANDQETKDLDAWRLQVNGYGIPLRSEQFGDRMLRLTGLRYREFQPWRGLHPGIPAQPVLVMALSHPGKEQALMIELHGWQPQGMPYPGLPVDLEDAESRTRERLVCRSVPRTELPNVIDPPAEARTEFCLDLRRINRGLTF